MNFRPYPLVDGHHGAEIQFDNVRVQMLGDEAGAFDLFELVIDEATVAICGEAVGAHSDM